MFDEHRRGDKYLAKKIEPRTTNNAKELEVLKARTFKVTKLKKKLEAKTCFQLMELKKKPNVRTCFQLIKLKKKIEPKTCFQLIELEKIS
jgi:hypothetical protein